MRKNYQRIINKDKAYIVKAINRPFGVGGAEQLFLDTKADPSKRYVHLPCNFRFSNGDKYQPDFYCIDDNEYIEVVGTRQAYHLNKRKYKLLKKQYPTINIVFVYICSSRCSGAGRPRKHDGVYWELRKKYLLSAHALKSIIEGKRYTKNIELIRDISVLTNIPAIDFINPLYRERYADYLGAK
jgi:hypothetical protein